MWLRLNALVLVVVALCQSFLVAYAAEPIIIEEDHPLLNDPEALQAMEIFMGMSPEEREDTIRGLLETVGDDPKARAEMELIISKLPALEAEQVADGDGKLASSLKQMVQDDELAKARQNAKKQMGGVSWKFFLENEEAILEATIAGGQLRPEDAALFKTDKNAWLKQLRIIWEDVAKSDEL
mmetsp:Transcript_25494/g.40026  ORF Transcript_25494/g.40026 Transcript_25494/m.40026 type:complete len:182 (-) Transcript_25494:120-665(-)